MGALQIQTVTTADQSLLHAVRRTLTDADEALLCVAFVQERGVRLIEDELKTLQKRRARMRLLVTTTFQKPGEAALSMASNLGVDVRVLNPGGGTYHPKVYFGLNGDRATAVVGSANLTGGLATNVEAGIALAGPASSRQLNELRGWAETLWQDRRAERWLASMAAEPKHEEFTPDLYDLLRSAVTRDPVFTTLGPAAKCNHVREMSKVELHVETERSRRERDGAAEIPAWMFNLAWERLKTHGTLTNTELLNDLRVHRSSAVCAILARLPSVEIASAKPIALRWRG